MRQKTVLLAIFSLFLMLGLVSFSSAQAEDADPAVVQALAESASLADEAEPLDGVVVPEPTSLPSGFGLWWQELRERVALGLTFDSVKKAEKQLAFAAERIKLAEYMLQNSAEAKVRAQAQQLLERAGEYMEKIQTRQAEFVKNAGQEQRIQTLLKNAVKNQLNVELILEKLEDKLPADKLAAFQAWREQLEAGQAQFINAVKNGQDLPQEIKAKATQVQGRVETMLQAREEFRAQQQAVLEEAKANFADGQAALEALRNEKQEALRAAKDLYKEKRSEILNSINAGQEDAVRELIQLNQAARMEVQNIQEEIKAKAIQLRAEIRTNAQNSREELQQNRIQQQKATITPTTLPSASSKPSPSISTFKPAMPPAATATSKPAASAGKQGSNN